MLGQIFALIDINPPTRIWCLVGDVAAVPELRAALTLTRGLGRPPFASSTNFTSGADANRQKAVRATLTRGGAVSSC